MTSAAVAKALAAECTGAAIGAVVALEIDPARVLAYAAAGALSVVVWFAQREWSRLTSSVDAIRRDVDDLHDWRTRVEARSGAGHE